MSLFAANLKESSKVSQNCFQQGGRIRDKQLKSIVFQYNSNEHVDTKILKYNTVYSCSKNENSKMLKKEIKDDLNKWRDTLC